MKSNCPTCLREFSFPPSSKKIFCSTACWVESRKVKLKCPNCFSETSVRRCDSMPRKKGSKLKFCSADCHAEYVSKNRAGIRNCSICGCDTGIARKRKYRVCRNCIPKFRRDNAIKNKLADSLRRRMIHVLKGTQKSASSLELIGCDANTLREHIQNQFTKGMRWNNYGSYWHVDHIVPCASFDLSDPDQQRKCFHFSNCRPLRVTENLSKGDSIIPCQPELTISLK